MLSRHGDLARTNVTIGWPIVANLHLNHWRSFKPCLWYYVEFSNQNQKQNWMLQLFLLHFSFVVLIHTNSISLILNCVMNYLVIKVTPPDFRETETETVWQYSAIMAHCCQRILQDENQIGESVFFVFSSNQMIKFSIRLVLNLDDTFEGIYYLTEILNMLNNMF